jgi:hypothetical protein
LNFCTQGEFAEILNKETVIKEEEERGGGGKGNYE